MWKSRWSRGRHMPLMAAFFLLPSLKLMVVLLRTSIFQEREKLCRLQCPGVRCSQLPALKIYNWSETFQRLPVTTHVAQSDGEISGCLEGTRVFVTENPGERHQAMFKQLHRLGVSAVLAQGGGQVSPSNKCFRVLRAHGASPSSVHTTQENRSLFPIIQLAVRQGQVIHLRQCVAVVVTPLPTVRCQSLLLRLPRFFQSSEPLPRESQVAPHRQSVVVLAAQPALIRCQSLCVEVRSFSTFASFIESDGQMVRGFERLRVVSVVSPGFRMATACQLQGGGPDVSLMAQVAF
mmetsp:Transcript_29635/g.78516  ORF Transcript_29635/g.78516 Transcript_29635/m.78516 type:complete len:292 (-) Transcript_29635:239-1114(-)